MKNSLKIIYLICIFVLITLGIIFQVFALKNNLYFISGDECHTILGSYLNIKALFTEFLQGTNVLPLYKCLYHYLYKFFGLNWLFFRIPSLFAGILSLFLFTNVLKITFKNKLLIIFCLFTFVFNHTIIHNSFTIKPYMYELVLTLILFKSADYLINKKSDYTTKELILYTLSSLFIVFFSLPSIVLIELYWGIVFIKNLIERNRANLIKLIIFQFFTALFIISEYLMYIHLMREDSALKTLWLLDFYIKPTSLNAINALINQIYFYYVQMDSSTPHIMPAYMLICFLLLFIIGIGVYISQLFRKTAASEQKYTGLLIITPVLTFIVLSLFGIYPFCNRLIIFLIPLIIIIMYKIFDTTTENKNLNTFKTVFIILLFLLHIFYLNKYNILTHEITNHDESDKVKIRMDFLNGLSENDLVITTDNCTTQCIKKNMMRMDDLAKFEVKNGDLYANWMNKNTKEYTENVNFSDIIKGKDIVYVIDFLYQDLLYGQFKKNGFCLIKKSEDLYPDMADYKIFEKASKGNCIDN